MRHWSSTDTRFSTSVWFDFRYTRFEQPFIAKKYYENSCVFIKLEEEGYGKISLSDLYLNGGNYSFYILQNQDKEYTNMQYEINNIKIGDSARYGKREIKVDIPEQSEIQNVNQLYVTSVFEQDGKVYVSVTNDSMESRTLKIVTEKEEKEFEVDRCWDGTSTEASDNEVQSFQKVSGMGCISGFLILVKDNLTLWMEISGTIDPHPTLASCLSSIFIYAHWRFICLDYVVIV